jgi:UDP-2-acetamido-3-amino-2,3-dideoxy-glucuronate N-acetyltransferase
VEGVSAITKIDGNIIIRDVYFGRNVRYFGFVNLYECSIGDDTKIGTFVEIQKKARVGNRCKISSHTFICEGVSIGDDVFVGHGVMFINDRNPRAAIDGKPIVDDWTLEETIVEDGVSIGSNATIMCSIRIGRGATIGAGAVVTRNVPANTTVVGNPARPLPQKSGSPN